MVFIDSNIAMYLVGAAHPNKVDAQRRLEQLVADRVRLVTDAEVMNEILHRYVALERKGYIQAAFDLLQAVVDEVLPVDRTTVEGAKQVVLQYPGLTVRVAMHVAAMQRHGIEQVFSFDPGFERVPRILRLR
ncbi:MAG: type II toxin-antitoxin system VapC family toxin [Sinobacteraceae bacterium]|nr:type II toxin-antitoxin system VapC family toxin [Nevskiaceae bacterium]MCP5339245.1 type II toxin-antitoxin system VapC family toxin [Nevskiaceae bacterium]MCP5359406.1 type II toxin-antitoxin system VapC family toxin [Nevskiaceae bacterium]MCP5467323.1 type II toxin-antitoxin system VapC family toxin [Nevskiaceae bacterium]MCP5470845.1 type II toxin-antitoxin system VapC family toxin [Nevskiaceae bacterium]